MLSSMVRGGDGVKSLDEGGGEISLYWLVWRNILSLYVYFKVYEHIMEI